MRSVACTAFRLLKSEAVLGSTAAVQAAIRPITASAISMKVYTKTGDKGTSSLYSGERRPKDDLTFEALGTVDELNSVIGVALEYVRPLDAPTASQLELIQHALFDLGGAVATPLPTSSERKIAKTRFDAEHTAEMERWIDAATESLPPLKQFILPGGGVASSHLHLARSTCRRAERSVVPLVRDGLADPSVGIFLNRLSDYLFTVSRVACYADHGKETLYRGM